MVGLVQRAVDEVQHRRHVRLVPDDARVNHIQMAFGRSVLARETHASVGRRRELKTGEKISISDDSCISSAVRPANHLFRARRGAVRR